MAGEPRLRRAEGEGWKLTEDGVTALDGDLPVNTSGGVLSSNPIGASGMLRFAEAAHAGAGLAGDHQVDGARSRGRPRLRRRVAVLRHVGRRRREATLIRSTHHAETRRPRAAPPPDRRGRLADRERARLEDVSLRKVAAEAGVSLRLVQYYFGTRDDLLLGALEILNADTGDGDRAGTGPDEDATPREVLRAMLVGMLPVDDGRRTRYLVHLAYFVRSLSDPGLASAFSAAPPELGPADRGPAGVGTRPR